MFYFSFNRKQVSRRIHKTHFAYYIYYFIELTKTISSTLIMCPIFRQLVLFILFVNFLSVTPAMRLSSFHSINHFFTLRRVFFRKLCSQVIFPAIHQRVLQFMLFSIFAILWHRVYCWFIRSIDIANIVFCRLLFQIFLAVRRYSRPIFIKHMPHSKMALHRKSTSKDTTTNTATTRHR